MSQGPSRYQRIGLLNMIKFRKNASPCKIIFESGKNSWRFLFFYFTATQRCWIQNCKKEKKKYFNSNFVIFKKIDSRSSSARRWYWPGVSCRSRRYREFRVPLREKGVGNTRSTSSHFLLFSMYKLIGRKDFPREEKNIFTTQRSRQKNLWRVQDFFLHFSLELQSMFLKLMSFFTWSDRLKKKWNFWIFFFWNFIKIIKFWWKIVENENFTFSRAFSKIPED